MIKKKILITGITGLVGTNLAERLKTEGFDVFGASRKIGIDLRNAPHINTLIDSLKPDVIYHLAANAAESRSQISPIDMTENNILIFVNTLRAAINAKVKRFIYTSSIAVYGESNAPYKETDIPNPKDVYGINKLACEQILKVMSKVYGFEYVILRPHNIYGEHQNINDPYRNTIALFMRKLMEGGNYKLYGGGMMRRAFSYVDDVVDVLIESLQDKFTNQIVNVGSDQDISIKELSDLLQKVTGIKTDVEMADARPQEISIFLADHSLQNSLVKYKETPLEEGLTKTWEWVQQNKLGELETKENEINV